MLTNTSRYPIRVLFFVLCSSFVYGQGASKKDSVIKEINALNFSEALVKLTEVQDNEFRKSTRSLINIIEHRGQRKKEDSLIIEELENSNKEISAINNLTKGHYILLYERNNSHGLTNFHNAYQDFESKNRKEFLKLSLKGIIELYTVQVNSSDNTHFKHIKNLESIAENTVDSAWVDFYKNSFYANSIHSPEEFFETSKTLINTANNTALSVGMKSKFFEDIGVYYRVKKNLDSAYYYNEKLINLPDIEYNRNLKKNAFLELALIEASRGNNKESKKYIEDAKGKISKSDSVKSLYSINRWKSIYVHEPLKEYDSAYYLLEEAMIFEANQNFKENQEQISRINVELETTKKEKQILIERGNKVRNQNIAIILAGGLFGVSLIGFLLFKNSRRKQRIAEQEREIEIQKTEKILREQELTTIDAMIAGQEKERQRLAGDLHDSVGATLAAAKLQFNHLKDQKNPEEDLDGLFTTTGELLEQAYQEIRSMAHLKNSGVIAKNGLLPAIEKLAKNASISNKLTIEVQDFGLDERLENSLEISIFRIIQELVTNIIKHSNASEASISITNLDTSLSIIVEDNGKGFNPKTIHGRDGMGLSSIEKRIEHLEGTMEVDSTIGIRTSILIDIPI